MSAPTLRGALERSVYVMGFVARALDASKPPVSKFVGELAADLRRGVVAARAALAAEERVEQDAVAEAARSVLNFHRLHQRCNLAAQRDLAVDRLEDALATHGNPITAAPPASEEPVWPGDGGHSYELEGTSDCAYGCGCWMGPFRSGGPNGVDPSGPCPYNPANPSHRSPPASEGERLAVDRCCPRCGTYTTLFLGAEGYLCPDCQPAPASEGEPGDGEGYKTCSRGGCDRSMWIMPWEAPKCRNPEHHAPPAPAGEPHGPDHYSANALRKRMEEVQERDAKRAAELVAKTYEKGPRHRYTADDMLTAFGMGAQLDAPAGEPLPSDGEGARYQTYYLAPDARPPISGYERDARLRNSGCSAGKWAVAREEARPRGLRMADLMDAWAAGYHARNDEQAPPRPAPPPEPEAPDAVPWETAAQLCYEAITDTEGRGFCDRPIGEVWTIGDSALRKALREALDGLRLAPPEPDYEVRCRCGWAGDLADLTRGEDEDAERGCPRCESVTRGASQGEPDESVVGFCPDCKGPIYHRPGKPGEFDHECAPPEPEAGGTEEGALADALIQNLADALPTETEEEAIGLIGELPVYVAEEKTLREALEMALERPLPAPPEGE